MGKWSLSSMFSIPHSDIPAPGIPYDWSILTVYVNHINCLASHKQGQRKNIVRVWTPSFTAHLDILTCHFDKRNSFSGSGQTEVFVKMLTGSQLLFSLSAVLRLVAFSLLACFFVCLHWPRAWHRLRELKSILFLKCYWWKLIKKLL